MSRPIIGLTVAVRKDPSGADTLYIGRGYADCLEAAGAATLLIPFHTDPAEVAHVIDGWVIPGGADFDAKHFGEENHPESKPEDPRRFPHEKELFCLVPQEMPILGICYGAQAINVIRGGTLTQHLPDLIGENDHSGNHIQQYALEPGSLAATSVGSANPEGKSNHHQAINRLGENLKVTGRTSDGVIEAIEDTTGRWLLGLQWHPEKTPDNPATRHLFREFVARAAEYKRNR